jgi:hypothetical protein
MKKEENLEEVFKVSDTATSRTEKWDKWDECEWCFQFDDEEPQVFACTDNMNESDNEKEITFTLSNIKGTSISFQHSKSGKTFKLFGREKADKGTEK